MNCGFIIRLSGSKISFLYNKNDKNGLFPFDGNRPVLPLAILRKETELVIGESAIKAHQTGSADAFVDILNDVKRQGTFNLNGREHAYGELLLLAIEKHISDFMQQAYLLQGKTYDSLKPELPIGFLFNDCVSDADQGYVMSLFESHGYGNVAKIDFSTFLFNNFSTPHVLVVSGDGHDIALRLYDRAGKKVEKQRLLPGAGVDPRVKVVAELFYNNLNPAGAAKEKVMPKLELEAMTVLEKNPAEHQGMVSVDGMNFEFFAMRNEIKAASQNVNSQTGSLGVAEFMHESGADMGDCAMIVTPTLAANSYFRNELKSSFPEVKFVDERIEQEVFKNIDTAMRDGGFNMRMFADADSDAIVTGPVNTGGNSEKGWNTLGNKMSKSDIKGEPHSSYIIFKVMVPKGADYVEISRRDHNAPKDQETFITRVFPTVDVIEKDGEEKQVIVPSEYTDTGLKELTSYIYNFVAVYFDEYGHESHTADLELNYRTKPDVVLNVKPVKVVVSNEDDNSVTLKWTLQNRENLRLYVDDQPFTQKEGETIVSEIDIHGTRLDIDENSQQYIFRKDFHGMRYLFPVTVRSGAMVAGQMLAIESNPQPTNVKASYVTAADAVRVEWDWKHLRSVQVVWQYKDDNPVVVDVQRTDDEGQVDVALHPKKSAVSIEVRSVYLNDEGTSVVGKSVKRTVANIPLAKVKLASVEEEGKKKFSYILETEGDVPVPCDLRLLVKEGSTDFTSPDKRIDIKREQWSNGKATKQFDYARKDARKDLNFRIEIADEAYAERLDFVAQEKTIEGNTEIVAPTFTEQPQSVSEPAPVPYPSKSGNMVRNIVIVILLLAAAFFGYNKFVGSSDEPKGQGEDSEQLIDYTSVEVEPKTVTLNVNETTVLAVTGEPQGANESITWESKNTDVASVSSDGTVTARKAGKAEIEGTTARSGLKVKVSVRVKVKDNPATDPEVYTNISASPSSLQLEVGQAAKVSLSLTPQKAKESISWSSNNSSVATVDQSGNVYARGSGTATILVMGDKSQKQSMVSVTVKGGVTPPPPPPPPSDCQVTVSVRKDLGKVELIIDGQSKGTIKEGSPWTGTLTRGVHTFQIAVKNSKSAPQNVSITQNPQQVRF